MADTNEQKSLGQIAHEAYLTRGEQLMVPWDKYPDVRQGFEKAASAVEAAVLSRLGGEWRLLDPKETHEAGDEYFGHSRRWLQISDSAVGGDVGYQQVCRRRIQPSPTPEVHVATEIAEQSPDFGCPRCGGTGDEYIGTMGGVSRTCPICQGKGTVKHPEPSPFLTPDELRALCGGQEPHRLDWKRDMLPKGYRPLVLGEISSRHEEGWPGEGWPESSASSPAEPETVHCRTTRPPPPLPQPPATTAAVKVALYYDASNKFTIFRREEPYPFSHLYSIGQGFVIDSQSWTVIDSWIAQGDVYHVVCAREVPGGFASLLRDREKLAAAIPVGEKSLEEVERIYDAGLYRELDKRITALREQLQQVTRERDEAVAEMNSWSADKIGNLRSRAEAAEKNLAEVEKQNGILEQWKHERMVVEDWWHKVFAVVAEHPDGRVGQQASDEALRFIRERDELKAELEHARPFRDAAIKLFTAIQGAQPAARREVGA